MKISMRVRLALAVMRCADWATAPAIWLSRLAGWLMPKPANPDPDQFARAMAGVAELERAVFKAARAEHERAER